MVMLIIMSTPVDFTTLSCGKDTTYPVTIAHSAETLPVTNHTVQTLPVTIAHSAETLPVTNHTVQRHCY